jgi:hypothetical protein
MATKLSTTIHDPAVEAVRRAKECWEKCSQRMDDLKYGNVYSDPVFLELQKAAKAAQDEVVETPAATLRGVIAKLEDIKEIIQDSSSDWDAPQIGSALADLERIEAAS